MGYLITVKLALCALQFFNYILFFRFRVMAIDHGQFSFVDVKHNSWPIVLVTNPKTIYLVPPVNDSVISSSHIRY